MDMSRSHLGVPGDVLERRHSDTSVPHTHMAVSNQSSNVEFPHPHFALIFMDHNGRYQFQVSPSIAGCEGAIFTPEVTDRFMEMTTPTGQPLQQNQTQSQMHSPTSPWGVQSEQGWMQAVQTRPAELIPCEWQSQHNRRKRRDMKRTSLIRTRPKSPSPPTTPPPGRSVLRVGNSALLRRYYEKAFEDFQQLNCRAIAKSYIKLVEPRKQVHYPYNGKRVIAGESQSHDPESTKPGWWPKGVLHKEPDHLLKRDRLRLLVHILCELKDSHGVTAEKLRDAGQDVRRQITPANRIQVLDEIYFVRQMEERYLDGEIDANTLVQVTHTHLPEANYQATDPATCVHAAPATSFDDDDEEDQGQEQDPERDQDDDDQDSVSDAAAQYNHPGNQALPLSPRNHPHNGYGAYPIGMALPAMIAQQSPAIKQQMLPDPHPLQSIQHPHADPHAQAHAHAHPMSGYYAQPYAATEKNTGYWPSVPHPMQYGY
ncbi:hypothetical protein N7454_010191 [Penicillium verhagenii]|nr:hypothetical protein N7454_010191 [Penicillium verhagenii]